VTTTRQDLSLIYLGKRGGGLNLLADVLIELKKMDLPVKTFVSSSSNFEGAELPNLEHSYRLFSPSSIADCFNINAIFNGIRGSLQFLRGDANQTVLFIMPSPFDAFYYVLAKLRGREVISCIHDAVPHSGEVWPSRHSISFRLHCSSTLVAFSLHIANQLRLRTGKPILLADLPKSIPDIGKLEPDALSTLDLMRNSKKPVVLLIGRLKEYKNVRQIFEIAQTIVEALFVVAGSSNRPIIESKNICILNRWLSNREFNAILEEADILVFPYTDASQSGTIPLAIKLGKIIVSANHPGLMDQLDGYERAIISEDLSDEAMQSAITQGMNMQALISKENKKVVANIREQEYSGLATVITKYLTVSREVWL
jgi:glycosyltransferase involved in cell wall biosynthesis